MHDIKGENGTLTSGWRARFGRVLLFDPTNPDSAGYNPLLEVRRGEAEVRDVQNVADILVDPEGALERRNHWEKTSHSLLVGGPTMPRSEADCLPQNQCSRSLWGPASVTMAGAGMPPRFPAQLTICRQLWKNELFSREALILI